MLFFKFYTNQTEIVELGHIFLGTYDVLGHKKSRIFYVRKFGMIHVYYF